MRTRRILLPLTAAAVVALALVLVIPAFAGSFLEQMAGLPAGWWSVNNSKAGWLQNCQPDACTQYLNEDGVDFARLMLDKSDGTYYQGTEVSELMTGFSYGKPTSHVPTAGAPVVFETRMRFSHDYMQGNASGGSAGAWMWNSYLDFQNQQFFPIQAIGWSIQPQGFAGQVLTANVLDTANNVYSFQPVPASVNISDWHVYRAVWYLDRVDFFIDGAQTSTVALNGPLSNMSATFWNDNQYSKNGYTSQWTRIKNNQWMDVDYVSVTP